MPELIDVDALGLDDDYLTIVNTLQRVLETTITAFDQAGMPLPARRYYTFNDASEDCAQLVVLFRQSYLGSPGDQASLPQRCSGPKSAVIEIEVSRDYPIGANGKAISEARRIAAAKVAGVDAYILFNALNEFDKFEDGGPGLGAIATVQVAKPNGGIQTTTMLLTVALG